MLHVMARNRTVLLELVLLRRQEIDTFNCFSNTQLSIDRLRREMAFVSINVPEHI